MGTPSSLGEQTTTGHCREVKNLDSEDERAGVATPRTVYPGWMAPADEAGAEAAEAERAAELQGS